MIRFILNDKTVATDLPPGTVLLDFIRYHQHLMGTKIGCREGDCGACTVLVGKIGANDPGIQYESMTSCLVPLANANGKHIVTIEGVNLPGKLNPIQQAMADEGATQCGFCTPGFVMSLAGHCLNGKENVIASIDGNICRCTGYKSIERAAEKLQLLLNTKDNEESISFVASKGIFPSYFSEIQNQLQLLLSTIDSENGVGMQKEETELQTKNYKPQTLVAGGTDLYVQKHEEIVDERAHYVFDDPAWNGIEIENNHCVIGASVTVTDLQASAGLQLAFPSFRQYIKLVSSTPIRNMATIAGNLVNASPIGDMTIFFLALDTSIELYDLANQTSRWLPLRQFYKGYKKLAKEPNEMISRIRFELPQAGSYFNFEKVSKRTHLDIASVNSAIYLGMKDAVIEFAAVSAGGVGPIPMYLQKTSAMLAGKTVSSELIERAITVMKTEISPISDTRGSKEYKTLLLGQLIKAHLIPLLR